MRTKRFPRKGQTLSDKLARERLIREATEKAAKDVMVKVRADMRVHRTQWLMLVAFSDCFGIGPLRFNRDYSPCLDKWTEWFNENMRTVDEDYADEKLRMEAQRRTGSEMAFDFDELVRKAKEKYEREAQGQG